MLGLMTLGLTALMIYTLVKNALTGTQVSSKDQFSGSVELIIPMTSGSEFYLEPWLKNLSEMGLKGMNVKIFLLVHGHHPSAQVWQELQQKLPFLEIHTFLSRPLGREPIPWMIEQIADKIKADVVIIGDSELVPTEHAFNSVGKLVMDKLKAYFVLPQTSKEVVLGEAIACLNPTLALASIYGFRKIRRSFSHPLISMSQGWMAMPLGMFKQFDWSKLNIPSWKETLAKGWDLENKTYWLAFGERHLLRYYPEDLQSHISLLKNHWEEIWLKGDRVNLWIFVVVLFIWSFPIFYFFTHPFWSLASIFLLILYRFFTKIIFQESWSSIILHPFAVLIWIGTFGWWVLTGLKSKYKPKRPV